MTAAPFPTVTFFSPVRWIVWWSSSDACRCMHDSREACVSCADLRDGEPNSGATNFPRCHRYPATRAYFTVMKVHYCLVAITKQVKQLTKVSLYTPLPLHILLKFKRRSSKMVSWSLHPQTRRIQLTICTETRHSTGYA